MRVESRLWSSGVNRVYLEWWGSRKAALFHIPIGICGPLCEGKHGKTGKKEEAQFGLYIEARCP